MNNSTDELLIQKKETNKLLKEENTPVSEHLTQQEQPQQIAMENLTVKKITAGLPEGGDPGNGDGAPPDAAPVVLQQEIAAQKTKAEKRALRRAQQEEQRRKAEEQQRLKEMEEKRKKEEESRLREEARQREEEQKTNRRHILTQSEPVADALTAYLKQQDKKLMQKDALTYLRTAAQELLDKDPALAEDYAATASYAAEIPTYRRLIAEQIESDSDFEVILEALNDYERRFRELENENVLMRVITFELPAVMEEHWDAMQVTSAMDEATTELQNKYQQKLDELMESFNVFDSYIAEKLNLKTGSEEKDKDVNAFSGPFAYAKSKQAKEQFQVEIKRVMEEQKLSPATAEEFVLRQRRAAIREQAAQKSLDGSVVHGLSPEEWAETGGASTHQTVPAAKALRLVKESGGFLCATDAGGGMMELHPSLPETVTLGGQQIPLRKTYNLMVKSMIRKMLDEKGRLLPKALDSMGRFNALAMTRTAGPGSVPLADVTQEFLQPLTELVGEEEALSIVTHIHALINGMEAFPPREIMRNLETFCANAEKCGIGAPTQQKDPNSLTLVERHQRMLETMFAENGDAPLSEEQKAQVLAVGSMYADVDAAISELMKIRDMDSDDPIVPIPNACSANGEFIQGIRSACMGSQDKYFTYRTGKQVIENPLKFVEYASSHMDELTLRDRGKFAAMITDLKQRLTADPKAPLSEEETDALLRELVHGETAPTKYSYHVAANLGVTSDGTTMTSEGFAAETKQYVVTPFTRQGAVGLYRSSANVTEQWSGSVTLDTVNPCMVRYYQHDESLPGDDERVLVQANQRLRGEQLPGDRFYKAPVKKTK